MKKFQLFPKGFLFVILAAFFGGGIPVFSKIALREIDPVSYTFLRFIFASILLFPFVIREKHIFKKELFRAIAVSFLATINVLLFAYGVKETTASVSQMLYAVVPVISSIISYFIFKEKFSAKKTIGITMGLTGVLIMVISPLTWHMNANLNILKGNLTVFTAVLSFSLYTVFSKSVQKNFSPLFMTFLFTFLTSIVLSVFFAKNIFSDSFLIFNLRSETVFSIIYVGFFGGALYYLLYQLAIKQATAVVASTTFYLQPVATIFWAFFLLGETVTWPLLIGGLLVFFGTRLAATFP